MAITFLEVQLILRSFARTLQLTTEWIVSKTAVKAPQDAFSTVMNSLQREWKFVHRVVPICALRDVLTIVTCNHKTHY